MKLAPLHFSRNPAQTAPFALTTLMACFSLALGMGSAFAQSPARPDAGQLLREAAPAPLALPPAARPLLPIPAPDAPALPAAGEFITVERFEIVGNTRITSAELEGLLADVQGKRLPFSQVQNATSRITAEYRARGFILARAFIPRQAMAGGLLRVQIAEGVIGEISTADTAERKAASAALLQSMLAAQGQSAGQVVQAAPLERAVLLFAYRGYADADIGLSPGSASGTTAVSMRWREQRAPWSATLGLDNNGSRYTGTIRALADAGAYSLLTQGDEARLSTSLTGMFDSSNGNTKYLGLAYKLPLGFDGWRLGANASSLSYALGGSFAALQADGRASTFGINASYPLHLSANMQSLLDLGLQGRRAVDDSLAGNVNDKSAKAALLTHTFSYSGALDGRLAQRLQTALTAGQLNLARNASAAAFDAANAASQGSYSKLRFDYVAAYTAAPGHQLQARISHQLASKNLDSSEKFSLGGSNGIRAYPTGEANGDGGTLLSLEWRADISSAMPQGVASSLSAFVDWGRIQLHAKPWAAAVASASATGIPNDYSLSGAGLTWSVARPGDWQLSVTLAAPIGNNPGRSPAGANSDGRGQHPRAWLSFQKYF